MSSLEDSDPESDNEPPQYPDKAPFYTVGTESVLSIEHPFAIRDIDKGISTLQGGNRLSEVIKNPTEESLKLYFRPGDRNSEPLHSTAVKTNDLLLKITVPRRTGRKRKRGDTGPFTCPAAVDSSNGTSSFRHSKQSSASEDSRSLLRSLRENPAKCEIDVVGKVECSHRFRGLPDFVQSTSRAPFMQKMKETILPFDYQKMKAFKLDMTKGLPHKNMEIISPPVWTPYDVPFNYLYRQNPAVEQTVDENGNATSSNIYAPLTAVAAAIASNAPQVPTERPQGLRPIEDLDPSMQKLITKAERLLAERPIYTRRALKNSLPAGMWKSISHAGARFVFHYVAYTFSSGPWRDAFIRFGVDPRTDPKYRIYQTLMFKGEVEEGPHRRSVAPPVLKDNGIGDAQSHLFDGYTVSPDTKSFQICDISDPLITEIFSTDDLREECLLDGDGFYHNGTHAKAKVITREKIRDLRNTSTSNSEKLAANSPARRAMYARIAETVPERVQRAWFQHNVRSRDGFSADEKKIMQDIQNLAQSYQTSYGFFKGGSGAIDPALEEMGGTGGSTAMQGVKRGEIGGGEAEGEGEGEDPDDVDEEADDDEDLDGDDEEDDEGDESEEEARDNEGGEDEEPEEAADDKQTDPDDMQESDDE